MAGRALRSTYRSVARLSSFHAFPAHFDSQRRIDAAAGHFWPLARRLSSNTIKSAPTDDEFKYTPLRPSARPGALGLEALETFRLIELLPGAGPDSLECRLGEVAMGSPQAYEAISYCWGDPRDKTAIRCNGKQLRIPSNLAAALRGLRRVDRPRHLWADAICIDQSDPLDKAMQVPHMRAIYSRSQRTLVWLGSMRDGQASPISLASRACIRICIPILGLTEPRRPRTVQTLDSRTGKSRRRSVFSGSLYLSLAYMLRRPWFRRAWVVQEAAVSPGVTIHFDHVEYDWEEVTSAVEFLSGVSFPLAFFPSPQHIAAVDHERDLYRRRASSLPGVLVRHQRCLASDQRDKVFAFAGLVAPDSVEQDVRVTYADADTPAVVFRELATRIMTRDQSLDILSGLPTQKASRVSPNLPSWVPDWSVEPDLDQGYTWSVGPSSLAGSEARDGLGQSTCRFRATRGSSYRPDISGDILSVPGHILGTVTYAGPAFSGVKLPAEVGRFRDIPRGWKQTLQSVLRARDVLAHWKRSVQPLDEALYPLDKGNVDAVFWETVCAGEHRSSPSIQKAARTWDRLMRRRNIALAGVLRSFDILGAFYATLLFVTVLLRNHPPVEHRLQGRYVMNRKMVKLTTDHIGLAHCAVEEGDGVFLLQGSNVPLVLRRRGENDDAWKIVGDAYVHGVMDGQEWDFAKCRRIRIT